MEDLMPRTVTHCPIARCPWEYDLARPRTEERPGGRLVMVVPPPFGEHLQPAEIAAGVAATQQPRMAAASPATPRTVISAAADLVMGLACAQDEAVVTAHLGGHSYADLAEALADRLDFALSLLGDAGYHPPVTIPMPGGPRLVAHWVDDAQASGYRCTVCHTVRASGPETARHFVDKHLVVSPGVRPGRPTAR